MRLRPTTEAGAACGPMRRPGGATTLEGPRREGGTMDRILIATDGSPSAQEAVEFGLELAGEQDAAVTFVLAIPAVDVVPAGGFGLTAVNPHEITPEETEPLDR